MTTFCAALLLLSPKTPSLAGASRSEKAGWTYVHLEGDPQQVGFQYGTLLYKEIDEAQKIVQSAMKRSTRKDWSFFRTVAKDVFWNKVDPEYQAEMKGQAEALKAKSLAYDIWDIVAFNAYIEIEGYYIPWQSKENRSGAKESCSAMVAVGDYTKGGKVVMAHNFWWDYLTGQRFNIMVDIKPKNGHRIMFDTFAGFIHSGTDWAINDAGIMITETTISGFAGFDPKGIPEFARMRKAMQYSESLDDVARIFKTGNNGGYANTWLLADTKRNEIGKLQLGLKNVAFDKTTNGAYFGANYPEDPKLLKEECKFYWKSPENNCEQRRAQWTKLTEANKGAIDVDLAKQFLADDLLDSRNPIGGGTCNSKVATSDMVKNWSVWGRMGFSNGMALDMAEARRSDPWIHDIASQPWTLLGKS